MLSAKHLSLIGFVIACVLFTESLRPVLLPLNIKSQIIFSAIVITLGYDVGSLLERAILKLGYSKTSVQNIIKYILVSIISIFTIFLTWEHLNSQQKHFVSLNIVRPAPSWIVIILGSVFLAIAVLQLGNIIRAFGKFCAKRIHKPRNRVFIYSLILITTTGLGYLLLTISIFALQVSLDISARPKASEIQPITSQFRSGGSNSVIYWSGLGQKGKEFISSEGALYDIGFSRNLPEKEMEPIRIYAGIGNEMGLEKRVDLIMREFESTKAFERSVVIMYTPSGSGWVNPVAVEAAEYITKGNSASVSLQYSDNQAVLQYIKDPKIPGKASALLFSKIRQRLDDIPQNKRPKLYIYGESLGSLGSQEIFKNSTLSVLGKSVDGALWVGSPYSGILWKTLGFDREPTSSDSLVHVGAHASDLKKDSDKWGPTRIAFLYNATDPIVWSNPKVIYASPTWLKEPRSPEISKDAHWLPLLTFGHMWFELFSAKNLPSSFGHNYDLEIPCALAYVIQAGIEEMC